MQIVNISQLLRTHGWRDAASTLNRLFGTGKWRYVGWGNRRLGLMTSPLANPYTCKRRSRKSRIYVPTLEQAILGFDDWLSERIQAGDERVLGELRKFDAETTLICWCTSWNTEWGERRRKICHAEVIARHTIALSEQENASGCGERCCDGRCSWCKWIEWEDRKAAEELPCLLHLPYLPYS